MTTLFSAALQGLGLSQSEASAFLSVRPDTVKSWGAGRNPVPDGVWLQLHALSAAEDRAAREGAKLAAKALKDGAVIELGLAKSTAEAQALGWPSVGAHAAVFRRMWEILGPSARIEIVERGSTVTSRSAISARNSRN